MPWTSRYRVTGAPLRLVCGLLLLCTLASGPFPTVQAAINVGNGDIAGLKAAVQAGGTVNLAANGTYTLLTANNMDTTGGQRAAGRHGWQQSDNQWQWCDHPTEHGGRHDEFSYLQRRGGCNRPTE